MNKPIVFFDLETTGTNPATDRIVSIAMMKTSWDGKECQPVIDLMFNPGVSIPAAATEVHGIDDSMVSGCPGFSSYAHPIYDYMVGCDVAGFNISRFDIPLLAQELHRAGYTWPLPGMLVFDSFSIFQKKHERTLAAAVKTYLDREHTDAHNATADVEATFQVFRAQLSQHADLGAMSASELSAFCIGGNAVDPTGKIGQNESGQYIYLFGKNKGKPVLSERDYAEWMLKSDFSIITKRLLNQILNEPTKH